MNKVVENSLAGDMLIGYDLLVFCDFMLFGRCLRIGEFGFVMHYLLYLGNSKST